MASDYDSFKVLQVECPRCGAKIGDDCLTAKGNSTIDYHVQRKAVVYPRYARGVSGGVKTGFANPPVQRRKLRNAVIDAALAWDEDDVGTGNARLYAVSIACSALKDHRAKFPDIRG